MDNLQTQQQAESTGNPQAIGQTSLVPTTSSLQGAAGAQAELLGLSNRQLTVSQCEQNCTVQDTSSPAVVKNDNTVSSMGMIGLSVLFICLIMWWFRRSQKPEEVEVKIEEAIADTVVAKPAAKKTRKKSKTKKHSKKRK